MNNNEFKNLEQQLRMVLDKQPSRQVLEKLESRASWRQSWSSRFLPILKVLSAASLIAIFVALLINIKPMKQADHPVISVQPLAAVEKKVERAEICNFDVNDPEIAGILKSFGSASLNAWQRQPEFSGEPFENSALPRWFSERTL